MERNKKNSSKPRKVRRVSQLVQVATIVNLSLPPNQTKPRKEMLSDTRVRNEGTPFPLITFSS
jgi:hypothetical protein